MTRASRLPAGAKGDAMTLADLRALLERMTPRPWRVVNGTLIQAVDARKTVILRVTGSAKNPTSAAETKAIFALCSLAPALLDVAEAARRESVALHGNAFHVCDSPRCRALAALDRAMEEMT